MYFTITPGGPTTDMQGHRKPLRKQSIGGASDCLNVNNGLPLQCFLCSEPSDASADMYIIQHNKGPTPISQEALEGSGNMHIINNTPFFLISQEDSEIYPIS